MNSIEALSRIWARASWRGMFLLSIPMAFFGLLFAVPPAAILVARADDVPANAEVLAVEADGIGRERGVTRSRLRFTTESGEVVDTDGPWSSREVVVGEIVDVRYDPSQPHRVHYPGAGVWLMLAAALGWTSTVLLFGLLGRRLARTSREAAVAIDDIEDRVLIQRSSTDQ